MKRKFALISLSTLLLLFILLISLKGPIMKGFASFLIVEDEIERMEYGFVLSGQSYDRGGKAAELLKEGLVEKVICTGLNAPPAIQTLGLSLLESDMSKLRIDGLTNGAYDVSSLRMGTSTLEEANAILSFCLNEDIRSCTIISSLFHTRRVAGVFKPKFKEVGIEVKIIGAPSSSYDEMRWWESENGLIALNNEYIKLMYYWWKY